MEFLIKARFIEAPFQSDSYIGTREELLRNIATTWGRVAHRVENGTGLITVFSSTDAPLATFTLTRLDAALLPGHF